MCKYFVIIIYKMVNSEVLRENSKTQFFNQLQKLKDSDSKKENQLADKLEDVAKHITCFYCLDYEIVYKDREGMFSNLDGRGDYDIINCECCKGNANWLSCSSGPASAYPGIVKRGTRERSWIECNAVDVGDSLVDKLKDKIGSA